MTAPYSFTPSQLRAVERMKAQGFTHGKIELEAQLNRGDNSYSGCNDCDEGQQECSDCGGSGVYEHQEYSPNDNSLDLVSVCDACDGDGYFTCSTCDGDWEGSNSSDYDDEDNCYGFIHNQVSPEARAAIVYSQFYNDGSVDSEFTFTMRLDDLPLAVEYLDAFKALADEIGGGLETSGAGMHLSVLTSGRYPSRTSLDEAKIANFKTEVTKLLPALYFAASPDHKSRGLGFRKPSIGRNKSGDYPAICTHDDTCLEYRIFETCYQRPTALLEDFEVIANTLKYYSNRQLKLACPKFKIGNEGEGVARFFDAPEKLRALNAGLPYIKPADKSIATLKRERNFKLTLKELNLKQKIAQAKYALDYREYVKSVELKNAGILEELKNEREICLRRFSRDRTRGEVVAYAGESIARIMFATDDELAVEAARRVHQPMGLEDYIQTNTQERGYAFGN